MPTRHARTPAQTNVFRLMLIERVCVDGKDFTRQESLFTAATEATYTWRHGTLLVTCTLTPMQGDDYWRALKPRYATTQEGAWLLTIGTAQLMVIGFVSEISCHAGDSLSDNLTYRVAFTPSGSSTIPYVTPSGFKS